MCSSERCDAGWAVVQVLSCDPKIVKIWEREAVGDNNGHNGSTGGKEAGAILTNVETPADMSDICLVSDRRGESGLMFMTGEQERVMAYYVPALGPAPKWCSFLDTITEELEEEETTAVYDDYKFVTRQEVRHTERVCCIVCPSCLHCPCRPGFRAP